MFFSNKKNKWYLLKNSLSIFLLVLFVVSSLVHADFSSTSFQIENPLTTVQGGESYSTSFHYLSSTGQLTNGVSDSTTFIQNAGFLYFPTATSPIVSTTAGDGRVTLNWTASTGVFANVTNYEVGISTSSGGTYTYTSVGNVLTYIKTGLTNGTQYFFKIRSYAAGILLTESAVVNSTPVGTVITPTTGGTTSGGGGGGGGAPAGSGTKVIFEGRSYPNSSVTLLKDAQVVATTYSGSDATFSITLNNLSAGTYVFGCYSVDKDGIRSPLQSFPITVTDGVTINVGGIFIAPTLSGDKSQVKQGDNITFFGQAVPISEVTISIHSAKELFKKVTTDKNGVYLKTMDTSELELGSHNAKSKVAFENQISDYGVGFPFTVGNENIDATKDARCPAKGDLNGDCKVNLIDFSIAAFWYKKPLIGQGITLDKNKLNGDGKINLVDFSIMAYYWTG